MVKVPAKRLKTVWSISPASLLAGLEPRADPKKLKGRKKAAAVLEAIETGGEGAGDFEAGLIAGMATAIANGLDAELMKSVFKKLAKKKKRRERQPRASAKAKKVLKTIEGEEGQAPPDMRGVPFAWRHLYE